MKRILVLLLILACVGGVFAHPHFRKTVTADLAGTKATITYATTPSNEAHIGNVAVGDFVTPRGPRLNLSAEITAGSATIPAGEYTIGVVRKADKDWAIALFPGRLGRGQTPSASELIVLDSMFSGDDGSAEHMLLDITPGHGKFEGRAVLTLKFGSLTCAGALS